MPFEEGQEPHNKSHGMTGTKLYYAWVNMRNRCFYPYQDKYKDYGGRGITVCPEWMEADNFFRWALDNGYEEGLTIERIDVNGNYEPANCTWIEPGRQASNRRDNVNITIDGVTDNLSGWSRRTGIPRPTLRSRYKRGLTGQELIKPATTNKRKN